MVFVDPDWGPRSARMRNKEPRQISARCQMVRSEFPKRDIVRYCIGIPDHQSLLNTGSDRREPSRRTHEDRFMDQLALKVIENECWPPNTDNLHALKDRIPIEEAFYVAGSRRALEVLVKGLPCECPSPLLNKIPLRAPSHISVSTHPARAFIMTVFRGSRINDEERRLKSVDQFVDRPQRPRVPS